MSSWSWVARTLKNLKLATPPSGNQRLMSAAPVNSPSLKPKRPLSPYFRFMQQVRSGIKKENPTLPSVGLMKIVGEQWNKLDDAKKIEFNESFKKDLQSYKVALEAFQKSRTPEDIALEQQKKMERQLKKDKRDYKKRINDLKKPKRPPSAFLQYLRNSLVNVGPSIGSHQLAAKDAAANWKKLTDKERAPYLEKYKEDLTIYEKDMLRWEEKMLKQGNDDLVRVAHLTKLASARSAKPKFPKDS